MWQYKDDSLERIETLISGGNGGSGGSGGNGGNGGGQNPPPAKKVIKTIHRQAMFPAKTLCSEEEIDAYVEKIRTNMKQLLKGCDGIKLN